MPGPIAPQVPNARPEVRIYASLAVASLIGFTACAAIAADAGYSSEAKLVAAILAPVFGLLTVGFFTCAGLSLRSGEISSAHSENSSGFLSHPRSANTANSTSEELQPLLSSDVPDASSSPLFNPA